MGRRSSRAPWASRWRSMPWPRTSTASRTIGATRARARRSPGAGTWSCCNRAPAPTPTAASSSWHTPGASARSCAPRAERWRCTWSVRSRTGPAAYHEAARAADAILIPAGEAWLRAMAADRRLELYGDAIHPSALGGDLVVLTAWFALFPAGPREFDEDYVEKIARELAIPKERRDLLFDAATRAIDEPLRLGGGSP